MKSKREHVVALSDDAIRALRNLQPIVGSSLLFPAQRGGAMSDMALTAVLRRMHESDIAKGGTGWTDSRSGRVAVVHGFRSTFRNWAAEMGYDRDMAEMALAHTVGSAVERAYRHTDMVERRRVLMQDWANYCGQVAASNVIPMKKETA
jgi:integrase